MKLSPTRSKERGFGLNGLLFAILVVGVAYHYILPTFQQKVTTAEVKAAETTQGVASILTRRF